MPESEAQHGISAAAEEPPSKSAKRPKRNRSRLRILLFINGLVAVLFVVSRLEPTQVAMLGPPGKFVHELFVPPAVLETSALGKRLIAHVRRLGGHAEVMERSRRYMGLLGNTEQFHIELVGTTFDDEALERLVNQFGDRIWGLDFRHTKVTDRGLRHLVGVRLLTQLTLGNNDRRFNPTVPRPVSTISDAGLIQLAGLRQLRNLRLSGLPITDAGLGALRGLPALSDLHLIGTKIKGPGLAQLKSLPKLASLGLDESEIDDQGLSFLTGPASLQHLDIKRTKIKGPGLAGLTSLPNLISLNLDESEIDDPGLSFLAGLKLENLSLNGVPLTDKGMKALRSLPRLKQLNVNRCGLLAEDLMGLRSSNPGLKIDRR
jgi:hypothetical protein